MKKENIVAITISIIGLALLTTALILVLKNYPYQSDLDLAITEYVYHNVSNIWKSIFYYITLLGDAFSYIAIILILYYVWDKKKVFRVLVVLFTSTMINSVLKYSFNVSRPPEDKWYYKMDKPSPAFPSGHAQINSTFWGIMATLIKKYWFIIFGITIALLVSISRILLCVHWFSDVIGGLGIGLIIIGAFIALIKPIETWLAKLSKRNQLGLVVILFCIYTIPIVLIVKDKEIMIEQLKFIVLFSTVTLSYIIEGNVVNFNSHAENWWKVVLRAIIATTIFFTTYFGLKKLFDLIASTVHSTILQITLDLLRYAILGPIAILLTPWFIMKLRL